MDTQAHGTLIEVMGVGVLLLGHSGIGKSECALELLQRGHRLVADDVVRLWHDEVGGLRGSAPEVTRHFMEIRGIGLLYVPDLYGKDSVCDEFSIDLLCRLEEWKEGEEFERVGLERPKEQLADVSLPVVKLPGRPAGSMATLVEVAVRDHQLRAEGVIAAEHVDARLRKEQRRP